MEYILGVYVNNYPSLKFRRGIFQHHRPTKFMMSDNEFEIQNTIFYVQNLQAISSSITAIVSSTEAKHLGDGRRLRKSVPRKKRTKFDHFDSKKCIYRDFLGIDSTFTGSQFKIFFRISRSLFQHMLEVLGKSTYHSFYKNIHLEKGPSLESRLLLPLKTNAYGVAFYTFCDYFQMSNTMARSCMFEFDKMMNDLFGNEFLRKPTSEDVKEVVSLHREVHKVPGLFGSLDCSHVVWKNCPKGWQGSFHGKEKKSTIVVEAVCDYHLWFWYTAFGYPGALNDINILDMSTLRSFLSNGEFETIEKESKTVPYKIGEEVFDYLWFLVDGIYPKYNRFVKGIKDPVTINEKEYTKWQESARKDVERAFGVLKQLQQFTCRPILGHNINSIGDRIWTAIIVHNMNVHDRIMEGDFTIHYKPTRMIEDVGRDDVTMPDDFDGYHTSEGEITSDETAEEVSGGIADLCEGSDHQRLCAALIEHVTSM